MLFLSSLESKLKRVFVLNIFFIILMKHIETIIIHDTSWILRFKVGGPQQPQEGRMQDYVQRLQHETPK